MSRSQEVTPVREAHRSTKQRSRDTSRSTCRDSPVRSACFSSGGGHSNPTFLLETARAKYVLRKKPPGKLLATAHVYARALQGNASSTRAKDAIVTARLSANAAWDIAQTRAGAR